jgi:hypothetical protein
MHKCGERILPTALTAGLNRADVYSVGGVLLAQVSGNQVELLRTAWQEADVCDNAIQIFLTGNSRWKPSEPLLSINEFEQDIRNQTPENLLIKLIQSFKLLYEPVQPMLNKNGYNPEVGFNSHTLENHIIPMARLAIKLLREKNESDQTINQLLVALFLHDIGNGQGRPLHGLLLCNLIPLIFGNEKVFDSELLWPAILAAITHDEKTGVIPILDQLLAGFVNGTDKKELIKNLSNEQVAELDTLFANTFSPTQAWIIFLDKIHFDEERLDNGRVLTPTALDIDPHILATLGQKLCTVGFDPSNPRTLRIEYDYSLYPRQQKIPNANMRGLYATRQNGGTKIVIPQKFRDNYSVGKVTGRKSYFEQSVELALELYRDRWLLAALAAFDVMGGPAQLERFELHFRNIDPQVNGIPRQKIVSWSRKTAWQEALNRNF